MPWQEVSAMKTINGTARTRDGEACIFFAAAITPEDNHWTSPAAKP